MKILLMQPPWYGFQNIASRSVYLGLGYIAAVLERARHDVMILHGETFFHDLPDAPENLLIDQEAYRKNFRSDHPVFTAIVEAAKQYAPDVIGISFMTPNSASAYYLAKHIKAHIPGIPLIAGGFHPTLVPEEPLTKGGFDYVVRGEGELTIVELINALQENSDCSTIAGISYIMNGSIVHTPSRPYIQDLNAIPFPAFHALQDFDAQKSAYAGIITSRGCPFACNYCASNVMWSRKVRYRTPDNVIEEIKTRYERSGIKHIRFHDDTFTLHRQYVEELCAKILALDFKIHWICDTRGDTLDLHLLQLMKQAGCTLMNIGLESGSAKIQQQIKKNMNTQTVLQAVELARKAGIQTLVYFMVGFPDETEEDIMESLEAMKNIRPDHIIWSILTPYPGTEVWDFGVTRGDIPADPDWGTFFHHYNRGHFFKTIPDESWNRILTLINTEQRKFNAKKTKKKEKNAFLKFYRSQSYRVVYAIKHPLKAVNYLKKMLNAIFRFDKKA